MKEILLIIDIETKNWYNFLCIKGLLLVMQAIPNIHILP